MKISVPQTLSLTNNKQLKRKLVGKIPVERLWELYATLDPNTEIAISLKSEIESQIPQVEQEIEPEPETEGEVRIKLPSQKPMQEMMSNGLAEVRDAIKEIQIPEYPASIEVSNFPEPKEYPTEIEVSNLPEPITEVSVSNLNEIEIPKEIEVKKPKWWKDTDLTPTNKILQLTGENIVEALSTLQEAMHDPSQPLKVQIINKRGEVIESFGSVAITGGGGGGSVEVVKVDTAYSNTNVTVGIESTAVLSANPLRRKFILANDNDTYTIYISFSETAELSKGYALSAGASMAEEMYRGAVSAISALGGLNLTIIEI